MSWLAGDFPSWAAVVIAVGAIVIAWRTVQVRSYIEPLTGWKFDWNHDSGDVEVSGAVTLQTQAAYVQGNGEISFGIWKTDKIKLFFIKICE